MVNTATMTETAMPTLPAREPSALPPSAVAVTALRLPACTFCAPVVVTVTAPPFGAT